MSGEPAESFSRLYNDNHSKVYRLALGLTGNANDAEEVTQEAFTRAFCSYRAFRRESSFFTWIYRLTLNIARDYLEQRTKPPPINVLIEDLGYSIEQIIDPDPANDPETVLLANELQFRCLHCFTECLPPRQRTVFCLVITLDLPYKTTAEIQEIQSLQLPPVGAPGLSARLDIEKRPGQSSAHPHLASQERTRPTGNITRHLPKPLSGSGRGGPGAKNQAGPGK